MKRPPFALLADPGEISLGFVCGQSVQSVRAGPRRARAQAGLRVALSPGRPPWRAKSRRS